MASKNVMSGTTGNSYEQDISLPNDGCPYSSFSSSDTPKQRSEIPIYDLSHDS
jgi:hypothetical protein